MERPKSYKEYSTAFLHIFIHAFASANRQKVIPAPILLDANSLQYRHLHRNYSKIVRYLESIHDNGKAYSSKERALYKEFNQIDRRLRINLGRQKKLPIKNLECLVARQT